MKKANTLLETYRATLACDNGRRRIAVTSPSGEQTAIEMVCKAENCPKCAIVQIRKIKTQTIKQP